MRIAFVADPESPNAWYRAIGPLVALANQDGHELRQVMRLGGQFRGDLVAGCDLLHIHRQHDRRTVELVRYARGAGIAVVWDNDDDFTAVPRGNQAYRRYGGAAGQRVMTSVRRLVAEADLVTTPSRVLAEQFDSFGAREVRVIENHVRDESAQLPPLKRDDSEVVVGWVAGKEHHLDAESLPIRAALGRLLEHRPDVRVETIGVGLGLTSDRYRHTRAVRFDELDRHVQRFDVGIAPIADIPVNRARSNVKVKEYAVVGVPWLASPIGPYVGLGERQGGRLVPDDRWFEELDGLVSSARTRRRLAKRARKWGGEQTVTGQVGQWRDVLVAAGEACMQR